MDTNQDMNYLIVSDIGYQAWIRPRKVRKRWSQTVGGQPQPRQRPVSAGMADGHHAGRHLRVERHHATSPLAGGIDKEDPKLQLNKQVRDRPLHVESP
jgi:hypothetical protein